MICNQQDKYLEPIAYEITDHNLIYKHHSVYTHLGCTLIRCGLGVILMSNNLTNTKRRSLIFLIMVCLVVFASKYYTKVIIEQQVYWKAYLRMLVAYSVALYLIVKRKESYAGIIIISDALMGIQSRHLASTLTCGINSIH